MKETQIQTTIEHYLQYQEKLGKLVYQKNNSGAYKIGTRFVRFGKSGSPDFYVFLKSVILCIEVKNENGRQTENQIEFQNKIERLGHKYFIVHSLDDLIEILKKYAYR